MNTFGWDTIFVLELEEMNKSLAKDRDKYLTKLSYSAKTELTSIPGSLEAELEKWEIVSSGSGKLLHLALPVQSGHVEVGSGSSAMQGDLAGITVILEVNLALVPSAVSSDSSSSQQDLQFSFKRVAKNPQDTGPGVVKPFDILDPDQKLSPALRAIVPSIVAEILVGSAQSMSYVFASINLVKPGTGNWLSPVQCDYTYFNTQSQKGYLSILSINDNRDISGLTRKLDGSTVPPSGNALYLISQELFLKNVIMPSLLSCYGASADVFTYDVNYQAITNTRSFDTQSVKVGAINYHPSIGSLQIKVDGGEVTTSIVGSCSLGMGINMSFGIQSRNSLVFDPQSKKISFREDGSPSVHHDASIPWYDWFLGPLPDIIMAIVVPIIAGEIADGLHSAGSGFNIASTPPTAVHWDDMKPLDVSQAGLNESLFLSGNV